MSDLPIPPGQMAFFSAPTGYLDASGFPGPGIAIRPNGEIVILGGGEGFVVKLTPAAMDDLAQILIVAASQQMQMAAEAADRALERVVQQAGRV